jgi:hypothetical protein
MLILGDRKPQKRLPKQLNYSTENLAVEMLNFMSENSESTSSVPPDTITPTKLISEHKFLLGRLVSSDIYDQNHEIIIRSGTVITASVVERARSANRIQIRYGA